MSAVPNYASAAQMMQMQSQADALRAMQQAREQRAYDQMAAQQMPWGLGQAAGTQGLMQAKTYKNINLHVQDGNLVVDGNLEVKGKIITKESKMLGIYGSLKNYIAKHADLIFTVLLVMLADKWFFKGAFTNTLQSLVGKLVNRAHDEVDSKPLTVAK